MRDIGESDRLRLGNRDRGARRDDDLLINHQHRRLDNRHGRVEERRREAQPRLDRRQLTPGKANAAPVRQRQNNVRPTLDE